MVMSKSTWSRGEVKAGQSNSRPDTTKFKELKSQHMALMSF